MNKPRKTSNSYRLKSNMQQLWRLQERFNHHLNLRLLFGDLARSLPAPQAAQVADEFHPYRYISISVYNTIGCYIVLTDLFHSGWGAFDGMAKNVRHDFDSNSRLLCVGQIYFASLLNIRVWIEIISGNEVLQRRLEQWHKAGIQSTPKPVLTEAHGPRWKTIALLECGRSRAFRSPTWTKWEPHSGGLRPWRYRTPCKNYVKPSATLHPPKGPYINKLLVVWGVLRTRWAPEDLLPSGHNWK